jgi:hypothetical protein
MGIGLRLALVAFLVALALVACFSPTTGACVAADPGEGQRIGTLSAHGTRWRVQIAELPPHCSGVTMWSPLGGTVSFAPGVTRATALHELGHALLGPKHLDDDGAIMHSVYRAHDLTRADLAYCRSEGVCSADATAVEPPTFADDSPAGVTAWAALRWDQFVTPTHRLTFTEAK